DVDHVKRAALRADQLTGIGAPNGIFAGRHNARVAAVKIDNRDLESPAAAHVERDLLSIRRPVWLRAITMTGGNRRTATAAGCDSIKLRSVSIVTRVNNFITARRP